MRKLITSTLFLASLSVSFAQLDPPSTMFWNNYTAFNPAAAGLHYKHQATASYRSNFEASSVSQQTFAANYNAKVKILGGGLGINYSLIDYNAGKQNRVSLNYSYHIKLGDNYTLGAGASAGVVNVDTRIYVGSLGAEPTLITSNKTAFIANLGVMLKSEKLTVGVSSTLLNNPDFDAAFNAPRRNFHVNADYIFAITRKVSLKPQALFTTDMDFSSLDLNMLAYIGKFYTGVTYRFRDAIGVMAGYEYKNMFRIGYSYEATRSKLNNGIYPATHEFMLGFVIKEKPVYRWTGTPSF